MKKKHLLLSWKLASLHKLRSSTSSTRAVLGTFQSAGTEVKYSLASVVLGTTQFSGKQVQETISFRCPGSISASRKWNVCVRVLQLSPAQLKKQEMRPKSWLVSVVLESGKLTGNLAQQSPGFSCTDHRQRSRKWSPTVPWVQLYWAQENRSKNPLASGVQAAFQLAGSDQLYWSQTEKQKMKPNSPLVQLYWSQTEKQKMKPNSPLVQLYWSQTEKQKMKPNSPLVQLYWSQTEEQKIKPNSPLVQLYCTDHWQRSRIRSPTDPWVQLYWAQTEQQDTKPNRPLGSAVLITDREAGYEAQQTPGFSCTDHRQRSRIRSPTDPWVQLYWAQTEQQDTKPNRPLGSAVLITDREAGYEAQQTPGFSCTVLSTDRAAEYEAQQTPGFSCTDHWQRSRIRSPTDPWVQLYCTDHRQSSRIRSPTDPWVQLYWAQTEQQDTKPNRPLGSAVLITDREAGYETQQSPGFSCTEHRQSSRIRSPTVPWVQLYCTEHS